MARTDTYGVIIAGGQSRRMGGGDKGLLLLGDRPVLAEIIARLAPQVAACAINANGNPARFADLGLPVLPDTVPGLPGPLAGVFSGMQAAAALGHAHVLTVPGDLPFLPDDLGDRLATVATEAGTPIAVAASHGQRHHIVARWSVSLAAPLAATLARGERRVRAFIDAAGFAVADYGSPAQNPFFNVNTPADLETARSMRRPDTG